jgi:hypothetical protein
MRLDAAITAIRRSLVFLMLQKSRERHRKDWDDGHET